MARASLGTFRESTRWMILKQLRARRRHVSEPGTLSSVSKCFSPSNISPGLEACNDRSPPFLGGGVIRDRVSLYSPGCSGTHSVDQTVLELRNPPASASQALGLQACATTARLRLSLLRSWEAQNPGSGLTESQFYSTNQDYCFHVYCKIDGHGSSNENDLKTAYI